MIPNTVIPCIYGHGEALMSTHVYLPVIKHGFLGHSPCHIGFFPTNHQFIGPRVFPIFLPRLSYDFPIQKLHFS